jgi:diguanylate cyclase (GGDEF)-like protein
MESVMSLVLDVTKQKQNEEKIYQLAFYDALTSLPNRRLLDDRLEQSIAACKRSRKYGAVLFLDLDNFKPLNDTHGHNAGDLLLVEVARRLTNCVREVDTVARFGGDEFVVVLSELDAEKAECGKQAKLLAEKILDTLSQHYLLDSNSNDSTNNIVQSNVTASIGLALFNGDSSAEKTLKYADEAMYEAKERGRNSSCFYKDNI